MYKRHRFRLYEGFSSVEEAKQYIDNLGFANHEGFIYIRCKHNNKEYIYPVTMENLALQIIITKEISWYRNRIFERNKEARGYVHECPVAVRNGTLLDMTKIEDVNTFELIGETFDAIEPKISSQWDNQYKIQLEEISEVSIAYKGDRCRSSYLEENCIILLSTLLFGVIGE